MNVNFDKTLVESLRDNILEIYEVKMLINHISYLINGCKIKRILRKNQTS